MGDAGFRHLGEDVVHEGYAMDVAVARYQGPDGSEFTRDVVRHVGAVAVVPLHDDGTVTLVRQYRAPIEQRLLEIPAGLRDVAGEPAEETAARELAEEVGLAADHLEFLCAFHNAAGFSDEVVQVFLGTGLREVAADLQGPEEQDMSVERLPLTELVAMIGDGRITDAKTIIGVLLVAGR
ncbi:NUDIX domain-containing protein [Actinospongicola halichondriae]|uniref:NUDIX domain-containing protein n=1 Tax=Actinospongicola halichondriae TaxID=3236844 RepID=UPI003D3CBF8E